MLGAKGAAHLVECFGSAEAVYSASAGELVERAELNQHTARAIAAGAAEVFAYGTAVRFV